MASTQNLNTSFLFDQWARCRIIARALKRRGMWCYMSGRLPIYLVPEYPKSGGTWFSQMLADCLGVPFFRNTSPQKVVSSVMSGHHLYDPRYQNTTVMFRDGRDVMISAYYHFLFKNDINQAFGVKRHRRHLNFADYDDIRGNLPQFVDYMFTDYKRHPRHFSWSDFVDSWIDKVDYYVTYGQLLNDPVPTLTTAVQRLTGRQLEEQFVASVVEKYSFKRQAGRAKGEANKHSFVRKGITGDWKNHFSKEACEVFAKHAGTHLVRLGFEKDDLWVNQASESSCAQSNN